MKTKQTPELIEHMFLELQHPSKKLSDWELNFIESVSDVFDQRMYLSIGQFEVLERIYAEKTA